MPRHKKRPFAHGRPPHHTFAALCRALEALSPASALQRVDLLFSFPITVFQQGKPPLTP